jgi:hypothetical protein
MGWKETNHEGFLAGSRGLVFDSPKKLHDFALRKGEIFQVEIEIVTPAVGTAAPH